MKKVSTLSFILVMSASLAWAQSTISFTNANTKLYKPAFHSGCAVSVVDMNGDGLDDIARMDAGHDLWYEIQNPGKKFDSMHIVNTGTGSAWSMVVGDADNNGRRDVAVGYNGSAKLVKANNNFNAFTLATLPSSNFFLQNMNFADINGDGWIDIWGCNDNATSKMWGNDGSGGYAIANYFNPATTPASDNSGNYGSIWTDFDNDGDIDFYVAHCRQNVNSSTDPRRINQLFVNNGSNQYTEDATGVYGLRDGAQTWTSSFEDIDNDGDLDVILTNYNVAARLLENDGTGHYTDITNSGFSLDIMPIQSKMEDFDNDGFVDIFVTGDDARLFRNNGNKTFTLLSGLFDSNNMESFACGDLNHDGKIDIYASYADIYTTPTSVNDAVWMNSSNNSNHFVTFNLQGTVSNRDALGARVEIYGTWGKQIREVRAGESYGTTNSFMCHFGLGTATSMDSAIIRWPSKQVTRLYNRAIDQFITVVEGQCSSVDNAISATGPLALCTGQSITLNAPAGDSYLWSTGETTSSITTSTQGDYSVRVTTGNCSSWSKLVAIATQPDETPTITVTGELKFCEGGSVTLQGPSGMAGYSWSSGESTQSISATESGSYTLTVQGACAQFSSTPVTVNVINSHVTQVTPASTCNQSAVTLSATGTGTLYWYDDVTDGNLLTSGNSYTTPPLTSDATYYIESHDTLFGASGAVGPTVNTIGAGGYFSGDQHQIFNVTKTAILKQVTVYAGSTKSRTIQLRNSAGTVLQQLVINIATGMQVIDLNWTIAPGTAYQLGWLAGSSPDFYRNSAGGSYPYTIAGLVSITGNSANDNARWYGYYNWQFEEPPLTCISTRTPVTATVGGAGPDVNIQPATDLNCTVTSVTLTASSSTGGVTYDWGNGVTTETHDVTTGGIYTVTVTDPSDGCNATAAVTVNQNITAPDVSIAQPNNLNCNVASVTVSASSTTTGVTYSWSPSGTSSSITANAAGTYDLTVTDPANGCTASASTTVIEDPAPTASFTGLNASYLNTDGDVTLTGTPPGGTFTGTGVTGNTFSPGTAGAGGPYNVTYTYTDGNGCTASETKQVSVQQDVSIGIEIPSIVSNVKLFPNPNTGQFTLSFVLSKITQADIAVFNALGQKVYEENNVATGSVFQKDIDLVGMAQGVYQLRISAGDRMSTYKVIIQ